MVKRQLKKFGNGTPAQPRISCEVVMLILKNHGFCLSLLNNGKVAQGLLLGHKFENYLKSVG